MNSTTKKSRLTLLAMVLMVGVLAAGWGIAAIAKVPTTLSGGAVASIQQAGAEKIELVSMPLEKKSASEQVGPLLACVSAGCNRPSSEGPKG